MTDYKTIKDDFAFLDDWEDRYRYIIELGKDLPPLAESERTAENKVKGCVSQVWLVSDVADGDDPIIAYRGESDAHIVSGLVAIVLALYSGRKASEIAATDALAEMSALGLDEHLSPQRANGLRAMVERIRNQANACLAGG